MKSESTKRSDDIRVELAADVILDFDWHNYGLDEVGEVERQYADYARELAARIIRRLDGES